MRRVFQKTFIQSDFEFVPGDLDKKGNERKRYILKENALPSLYLKGSQPESNENEPPRKKVASEADIRFNHTYCAQQQDPVEQVVVEAPEDNNDLEDVIIATAQDVPGNELEILEDTSLTQQNYEKILDEKNAYIALLERDNLIHRQKLDSVKKVFGEDQMLRLQNPSSRMP